MVCLTNSLPDTQTLLNKARASHHITALTRNHRYLYPPEHFGQSFHAHHDFKLHGIQAAL